MNGITEMGDNTIKKGGILVGANNIVIALLINTRFLSNNQ
jgi:hypothetical protein